MTEWEIIFNKLKKKFQAEILRFERCEAICACRSAIGLKQFINQQSC